MNKERLAQVVGASDTAKSVFKYFEGRERSTRKININAFKSMLKKTGYNVKDQDLISLFKELEALEIGKLELSSRGAPKFFHWNYRLISVVQAIKEGSNLNKFQYRDKPLPTVAVHEVIKEKPSALRLIHAKLELDGEELEVSAKPETLIRLIRELPSR